jgi:hypothetical protein
VIIEARVMFRRGPAVRCAAGLLIEVGGVDVRVMKTICSAVSGKTACAVFLGAILWFASAGAARAQTPSDPNQGALTFTGGLDVPQVYFFRGIRQEADPKLTLFPYGDIGIALSSGGGSLKSSSINFGVWNSLQTGSSGTGDGCVSCRLHYEEDFYATLNLGFGGGIGVATTFTAYTSPNNMFTTVKEIGFKVTKAGMLAPYGIIAFEIGGDESGQADAGDNKGTYVELGIGPSWALAGGKATIAVPVKIGLSAKDYYELNGEDNKFGFFDIGALITVPLKGVPSQFGAWNIHGGADFLALGDTTKAFNVHKDGEAKKGQVIGLFGIGVSY